jgi:hypothetical protein
MQTQNKPTKKKIWISPFTAAAITQLLSLFMFLFFGILFPFFNHSTTVHFFWIASWPWRTKLSWQHCFFGFVFNFLHKKNKTVPMSRMSRWFTSKLVHEIYKGINYFNNLLFFFILTEVCWLFLLKFIIQIFLSAIELFSCNVVSLDFFLFFLFFTNSDSCPI